MRVGRAAAPQRHGRSATDWYEACGQALHVDGRRFYDDDVARELLESIGAAAGRVGAARSPTRPRTTTCATTTSRRSTDYGGFGVPIIVLPEGRAVFGPVVVPAPSGDAALDLWDLTVAYASFPGLFELKTPKTAADLRTIAEAFAPYLAGRQWETIQKPAP